MTNGYHTQLTFSNSHTEWIRKIGYESRGHISYDCTLADIRIKTRRTLYEYVLLVLIDGEGEPIRYARDAVDIYYIKERDWISFPEAFVRAFQGTDAHHCLHSFMLKAGFFENVCKQKLPVPRHRRLRLQKPKQLR